MLAPGPARAATLLLDALCEREDAPPPADGVAPEVLRERLREGDGAARDEALAFAHGRSLRPRVAALLAMEHARVTLPDGGELSVDEAERLLANKEDRRTFAPLRKALDAVARGPLEAGEEAGEDFEDALEEAGLSTTSELVDVEGARASLDAFLGETRALGETCLEVLESEGGAPARDPAALSRALDLPDEAGGFSSQAALAFGRALSAAAERRRARGLVRLVVPRALAGLVVTAAPGPVRVGSCAALRAWRFASLVDGAASGVAAALFSEQQLSAPGEDAARTFGRALGLSSLSPTVRMAILDEGARAAEKKSRVGRATWLLHARLRAAVARALLVEGDDPEQRFELAHDAVVEALGASPEAALVRSLLLPPWPGLVRLRGRVASLGGFAVGTALAVDLHLRLRERFDEAFALVPAPYDLVADAAQPLADGAVALAQLVDGGAPSTRAGPLVSWASELL